MAIEQTTLPNGITVFTDFMPHAESVAIHVGVGVGSRYEHLDNNGVAHFLEHMAFKGTKSRTALQIAEEFDAIGGASNACTDREQTLYYARVLNADAVRALDILADILQHSIFDEEEFYKEQSVILQEIAQNNDTPEELIFDVYMETAFPDQSLGRNILGTEASIKAFTPETLKHFIGQHYHGKSMAIGVAGNIEHDTLVNMIKARFADMKDKIAMTPAIPHYQGGINIIAKELEQVQLIVGFPSISYLHPDYYTGQVLAMVLGGGMSSRLFQEVREKRGLAYSVHTFTSSYHDTGILGIYAGTGADELSELLDVLQKEIHLMTGSISEAEIARAKAQLRAGILMGRESVMVRAEDMVRCYLAHGCYIPYQEILEAIDKVNAVSISTLMTKLLQDAHSVTVSAIGPIKKTNKLEAFASGLLRG